MNIWLIGPLRKALKGTSLTWSLVVTIGLLGGSFAGLLRHSLHLIGLWMPLVFVLPLFATGWLAKREHRLPVSPLFRRNACWAMMTAGLALALAQWGYRYWLFKDFPPDPPAVKQVVRKGPAGKR
jgi:hypothetical protein